MSKVPTEEEVREYFQRAYYVTPEGQLDWIGPVLPADENKNDDDSEQGDS